MKKSKKNESGRSMLEMLGVLVLLMLLTLGGLHVWGLLRSDVVTKDVTTAVMEEAMIRQHALRAKPSDTPDEISREAAHDVKLTVENGIDGAMSDYFWVKTDALSEEVCDSMLKKAREMQPDGAAANEMGLVDVRDANGKRMVSCSEDKTKNVLQYLFQKEPGYHLHGVIPWWVPPYEGCTESMIPNGGSVTTDVVLVCGAGYYKTGYGTCDETCKPCTGNTYRAVETTTENSSCETCEEPRAVNSRHTSCDCNKKGEECADGGHKGTYNENCGCDTDTCTEDSECDEGQKCCEGDECCECETNTACPTCPEAKPYWDGTKCVACRTDDDCEGDNAYCDEVCRTCPDATPHWDGTQCVVCRTDADCGDNEYCKDDSHTCATACTDGKSTYNKETKECDCNDHGDSYSRGGSSTCYTCGVGAYAKLPQWDEEKKACICTLSTSCDDTESCEDGECKPIKTCDNFEATACRTACNVKNHQVEYTYAPVTKYYNDDTSTHKHCGDPNDVNKRGTWVCDTNYLMREDGTCKNGCDGFVATKCTKSCSSTGGETKYTYTTSGTSCGTHQVCDGNGSCVCTKGYELKDNVCTAVAVGWYKDVVGNTGAQKCADWRANSTTTATGSTSTSACVCDRGYVLKDNECTAVAVGYYKSTVGNTGAKKCVDWRAHTTTASTGTTAVTDCVCIRGYELKNKACSAVIKGWYKDIIGNTGAQQCPAGETTDGTAKTDASACFCPTGRARINGTCTKCPKGQYSNKTNADACTDCPAGKYSATEGATSCTNCPKGTYNDTTGATSCKKCPKGQYNGKTGATSCTNCPAGKYSPSEGATACKNCPKGKTSSAGASSCTNCEKTKKCGCATCANGKGGCQNEGDGCVAAHGGNCSHYETNGGKTGCWNNGWSVTNRSEGKCTRSGWTFYGRAGSGVCKQYCGSPKSCK